MKHYEDSEKGGRRSTFVGNSAPTITLWRHTICKAAPSESFVFCDLEKANKRRAPFWKNNLSSLTNTIISFRGSGISWSV